MARIYVLLGGAQAFQALVEELDRRILQDQRLRPYFDGVSLEQLQHHQHSFLAMAFGGPPGYLGRTVQAAHSKLEVTDEAFDRVLDHLIAALVDLGVTAELIREVACTLLPLRHDIVRTPGPPPGLGPGERPTPQQRPAPVLKEGLLAAKPRPVTPYYQEVTSAIEEDAYAALQGQKAPDQAINDLNQKLNQIAAQGG